jgi:hypothetical protein
MSRVKLDRRSGNRPWDCDISHEQSAAHVRHLVQRKPGTDCESVDGVVYGQVNFKHFLKYDQLISGARNGAKMISPD